MKTRSVRGCGKPASLWRCVYVCEVSGVVHTEALYVLLSPDSAEYGFVSGPMPQTLEVILSPVRGTGSRCDERLKLKSRKTRGYKRWPVLHSNGAQHSETRVIGGPLCCQAPYDGYSRAPPRTTPFRFSISSCLIHPSPLLPHSPFLSAGARKLPDMEMARYGATNGADREQWLSPPVYPHATKQFYEMFENDDSQYDGVYAMLASIAVVSSFTGRC